MYYKVSVIDCSIMAMAGCIPAYSFTAGIVKLCKENKPVSICGLTEMWRWQNEAV